MNSIEANIRGAAYLVRKQFRKTRFKTGLAIVLVITILALLSPIIAPFPEEGLGYIPENAVAKARLPPNPVNIFGTDTRGRDLFSRVLFGAGSALVEILIVVLTSLSIGIIIGVSAAYFKGVVEHVLNYLIELFVSVPAIIIALALRLAIGPGLYVVILGLITTWWSWYARVTYIYARSIVEMDYVVLARLSGLNSLKIIYRHVLRNTIPPVLVQAVTDMGSVLLEATSINFIGLGVPLNSPEWGVIMLEGLPVITIAPWITMFPGIFLLITALGFSLIGDSLREELDPRMRRRWRLWF
ncbi:ABC transporter permease [Desulfurococcus amylolyticus]|uniref:Binding-protein-dependent transport systems inner membrane component n=1 Tax=Desulfurococcus amylolyticus (strain DSM 18924 / JCM 16383 / VKM B-2413 / 1221n) TaxID=490899 RepID=B8D312_DESA1|nr:ABC transporter permease [Desulfurococcus amylolyticus]ACL10559.1 binding-protein-dependent transport systems inner membrane component [Desulfurococcus amylolyticus 1221n]